MPSSYLRDQWEISGKHWRMSVSVLVLIKKVIFSVIAYAECSTKEKKHEWLMAHHIMTTTISSGVFFLFFSSYDNTDITLKYFLLINMVILKQIAVKVY